MPSHITCPECNTVNDLGEFQSTEQATCTKCKRAIKLPAAFQTIPVADPQPVQKSTAHSLVRKPGLPATVVVGGALAFLLVAGGVAAYCFWPARAATTPLAVVPPQPRTDDPATKPGTPFPALGDASQPWAAPPVRPETKSLTDFVYSADQAIVFFQDRIKNYDRLDPSSHVSLGEAFIRKARETGDFSCYARAEKAIRAALEIDPKLTSARFYLGVVLSANHQFAEALALARAVDPKSPDASQFLVLMGDAHLEMGNYAEAEKAYQQQVQQDPGAKILSRLARLAELKGHVQEAIQLMERAAQEETRDAISPTAGAWYQLRLGEMHFNAGRLDEAERHYQATLKLVSRNAPALVGLGKIQAARGKDLEAIDLYMRAVSIGPQLAMLADLGDLYARTGKDFVTQLYYEKVEREGVKNPAFNRELSLFYSNHDRKLPEALDLARKDLAVRKDIYAYDTLAWALCKNQHYAEARDAITEALSLGTQDAGLHYHAGVIYQGLQDTKKAREYLERALAINPHFSVALEPEARRRLEELKK